MLIEMNILILFTVRKFTAKQIFGTVLNSTHAINKTRMKFCFISIYASITKS